MQSLASPSSPEHAPQGGGSVQSFRLRNEHIVQACPVRLLLRRSL